jgi:hypothetical protein
MSLVYTYPYYDVFNWEFVGKVSVAHKGYTTRVSEQDEGVYKFTSVDDAYTIDVTSSLFETPPLAKPTSTIPTDNIMTVSMVCSGDVIIPITDHFLRLRHPINGWFSGHQLQVHEILPFFCEKTRRFEPLIYFETLRIMYLDEAEFEIKNVDFDYYDVINI